MTGTHGSEDGRSALTDSTMIDNAGLGFYQEDCWSFGVKAGPRRSTNRPPLAFQQPFSDEDWKKLHKADITKPAKKLDDPPPNSFPNDELMKKCDIRVANMTYYYKNGEKLIRDINEECLINYQLILSISTNLFHKNYFKNVFSLFSNI